MPQTQPRPREDYSKDVDAFLASRTRQKVREEAQRQGIDPDLAERVGNRESRYKPTIISG
ncbi:MAG: hypothetical protein HOP19_04740, partial [Acidobacteria bacterium]|nr:hypothetical protein [Acidobacteriota bacterium]